MDEGTLETVTDRTRPSHGATSAGVLRCWTLGVTTGTRGDPAGNTVGTCKVLSPGWGPLGARRCLHKPAVWLIVW